MRWLRMANAEAARFQVVGGTERSQGVFMTRVPGEATGGHENRHPTSDERLFVVSGSGRANIDGARVALEAGELVQIGADEGHESSSADGAWLVSVSVFARPAH